LLLPVEKIDWVETQGNYLALHIGPDTHLIRGTLASFGSSLDPDGLCEFTVQVSSQLIVSKKFQPSPTAMRRSASMMGPSFA
jgi:DNA-binding LytR/AlgR family response regulator